MKDIKFIRYGGLSPVKQTHYLPDGHPDKGFHNPPKKRGIYAMIKGYEELFLIGATYEPNHSGKSEWLKDDDGELVSCDEINWNDKGKEIYSTKLKKLLKKRKLKEKQVWTFKGYIIILKQPKIFEYKGELWHHLIESTSHADIIDRCGNWIKTSYNDFVKAFNKNKHLSLKELHKEWVKGDYNLLGNDPYRNTPITYNKDCLEVFIEKI